MALRQAEERKARFLASMAHELRTPLSSILILADLLAESDSGNLTPKQLEYTAKIHRAATDVLALVNEVMDLAKLEAGRVEVYALPVSLADLAGELRKGVSGLAGEKGVPLTVDVTAGLPRQIRTDRNRLEAVLTTLLTAAFRHTDEGQVTLALSPLGEDGSEGIEFAVSDTGDPVPEAQREAIFEPLAQADLRTSREYGGMGLGLAIARELARLLGGELALTASSRGNTFILRLPLDLGSVS